VERTDLRRGAWLDHDPEWLAPEDADALLAQLRDGTPWQERAIVVFGREVLQPRLVAWYGELPYRYSGQTLEPRPEPDAVRRLREQVSEVAGTAFNHVVLNLYRDGGDHVALHSDSEPELGREPVIASLSLGARRRFVLQPKRKRRYRKRLWLTHGSLLVMGGTLQHLWRHEVPREPAVTEARVNVTFRRLLGPPGWRPSR